MGTVEFQYGYDEQSRADECAARPLVLRAPGPLILRSGRAFLLGLVVLVGALVCTAGAKYADAEAAVGTWKLSGSMTDGRAGSATLLGGTPCQAVTRPEWCGKVLVAGGLRDYYAPLKTAELYDPKSGRWSPAGSLDSARSAHTATLLANGKVLVTRRAGRQRLQQLRQRRALRPRP